MLLVGFLVFLTVLLRNMSVLFIYLLFTFTDCIFWQYVNCIFCTFDHLKAFSMTVLFIYLDIYIHIWLLFGNILIIKLIHFYLLFICILHLKVY